MSDIVKPLEWVPFGGQCLRSATIVGFYEIMWGYKDGSVSLDIPAKGRSKPQMLDTPEAAKAAAQADYEARIMSALHPVYTRAQVEAMVAALEPFADIGRCAVAGNWGPVANELIGDMFDEADFIAVAAAIRAQGEAQP